MSYTLAELATRVLRDAGLIAADETPSGDDLTWAEETAQGEIASMLATGIRIWDGSSSAVPTAYFIPLSLRIGAAIAPSFALLSIVEAEQAKVMLEQRLRAIAQTPTTYAQQEAEYF